MCAIQKAAWHSRGNYKLSAGVKAPLGSEEMGRIVLTGLGLYQIKSGPAFLATASSCQGGCYDASCKTHESESPCPSACLPACMVLLAVSLSPGRQCCLWVISLYGDLMMLVHVAYIVVLMLLHSVVLASVQYLKRTWSETSGGAWCLSYAQGNPELRVCQRVRNFAILLLCVGKYTINEGS